MNCHRCGSPAEFVPQYRQFWCQQCQAYLPPPPKSSSGTAIALAICLPIGALVILGILAAVAIPSFMHYMKEPHSSEATKNLQRMYDGARAYYMDGSSNARDMIALPPQFPAPSTEITPPLGSCCDEGGKCMPSARRWMSDVWSALEFSVDDPHFYSYQYEVAPDGQSFTVRAFGDLDCDAMYSTFEMTGVLDANGELPATTAVYRNDELE